MEIREFTTYNEQSPISGYGVWIVIEQGGRRVHLLHPISLSELIVTEVDFKQGSGNTIWPINSSGSTFSASRFIESFKKRIMFFIENHRPFPINTVAKAIAFFEEMPYEEALKLITNLVPENSDENIKRLSNKATRSYVVRKNVDIENFRGRAKVILDLLDEHGPASIYQLTSLAEGKLKTKSGMNRVVTYFVNKMTAQGILEIVA